MSFLYSVFLKLLYPTSLVLLMLLFSVLLQLLKKEKLARTFLWTAIVVLLVCGNGWVIRCSTRHLERQYPASAPKTVSVADCILILGGGTWPQVPPRQTPEVAEAGDRILYAAHLFKAGKAPFILCTSGIAMGGLGSSPASETMSQLLEQIGVPTTAILQERKSRNTHEHGRNLQEMLRIKGFKRVLLVTSALHMPRAMAVFRRSCPSVEFIAAPTDFRIVDVKMPWYRELVNLIPTPTAYVQFSDTLHEYLGMAYYKLRGWI